MVEGMTLEAMLFGALRHVNLVGEGKDILGSVFLEVDDAAIALADDDALRAEGEGVGAGAAVEAPRSVDATVKVKASDAFFACFHLQARQVIGGGTGGNADDVLLDSESGVGTLRWN